MNSEESTNQNTIKNIITSIQSASNLVVIVGDVSILEKDPSWNSLIQYCKQNNGYVDQTMEEVIKEEEELEDELVLEEEEEEEENVEFIHNNGIESLDSNNKKEELQEEIEKEQEEIQKEEEEELKEEESIPEITIIENKREEESSPSIPIHNNITINPIPSSLNHLPTWQTSSSSSSHPPFHPSYSLPPFIPVQQQLHAVLQGNRVPPEMLFSSPVLPVQTNPFIMGIPFQSIPTVNIPDSYEWIHDVNGHSLIGYNKEGGYPPLVVNQKPDCVEIEISLFNLVHILHQQGNWIYIQLFQNLKVNFLVSSLFGAPTTTKEHYSELVISIPGTIFDMRLLDIAVSRNLLLITLPFRRALPNTINDPESN